METLEKMLNVIAWILVIVNPILIGAKIWLQFKYNDSLEEKIDNLNGYTSNYTHNVKRLLIVFVLCLIYLIVK